MLNRRAAGWVARQSVECFDDRCRVANKENDQHSEDGAFVEPSRCNHWQSAAKIAGRQDRVSDAPWSVTVVVFQRPEDEAAQPGAKVRPHHALAGIRLEDEPDGLPNVLLRRAR
jgi:hypothetical protein